MRKLLIICAVIALIYGVVWALEMPLYQYYGQTTTSVGAGAGPSSGDGLLLNTGDYLLLNTGDYFLLN